MFFKKQNALTRFILKYQIAVILTGSFILGAGTGKIVTRIEKLPKHVPSIASSSINSSSSAISSESTNWGLGFDEEGKRPTGNASIEQLKKYNAYYAQNTDSKILYLTFDAGYENGNTPAILDALKNHNCPATFFVVGNFIADNPKLIQRMISEGHTVGNHTMTHPDMSKISSVQAFQNELSSVEQLYKNITDQDMPKLYRPPRGIYSTENLTMAKNLGYSTFFWSLAYVDWIQDQQPSKEEAFDKLLSRIHPWCHRSLIIHLQQMQKFLTNFLANGKKWDTDLVL